MATRKTIRRIRNELRRLSNTDWKIIAALPFGKLTTRFFAGESLYCLRREYRCDNDAILCHVGETVCILVGIKEKAKGLGVDALRLAKTTDKVLDDMYKVFYGTP